MARAMDFLISAKLMLLSDSGANLTGGSWALSCIDTETLCITLFDFLDM
jgi:hypothetical protein